MGLYVEFRRHHPEAKLPQKGTDGSRGYDLCAVEWYTIPPNGRVLVNTGLEVRVPDGYVGDIRPRSGLAIKQGITVLNSPGTIDGDFRDPIQVILHNTTKVKAYIERGQRIAQIVFVKCAYAVDWVEVTEAEVTGRTGGFGSTGEGEL